MRKRAGLNQAELAERAGMDQTAVSNYENGRRPLSDHRKRIFAKLLGCTVADLLDEDDNPHRLSAEERELVEYYRAASKDQQELTLRVAAPVRGYRAQPPPEEDEAA